MRGHMLIINHRKVCRLCKQEKHRIAFQSTGGPDLNATMDVCRECLPPIATEATYGFCEQLLDSWLELHPAGDVQCLIDSLDDEAAFKLIDVIESRNYGIPLPEEKTKRKVVNTAKKVICTETGRIFPSIKAAAREMGVSVGAASRSITNGHRCKGSYLRFIDE